MYKNPGTGGVIGGGAGLAATGADLAWWLAIGTVLLLLAALIMLRGTIPGALSRRAGSGAWSRRDR